MKIRSITCFYDPGASEAGNTLENLAKLAARLNTQFADGGFEVQSVRLATVPFPQMCPTGCLESGVILAQKLEDKANALGFSYLSMGPALPDYPESYAMIPEMLEGTKSVFFSASLLDEGGAIRPRAVRAAAEIICKASTIGGDGFANLRFAAIAGVKPFTPFFPAAYSQGNGPAFSIAVECADLIRNAFQSAATLQDAREQTLQALEGAAAKMTVICLEAQKEFGAVFKGFDFSPAPYPEDRCSIGSALESLGVPSLGLSGSAAAAAFLAGLLDEGDWQKAGFNGLMLPVLEDGGLAGRAKDGHLTTRDLLLYSCLCGTGLDTVPLAGDTDAGQISALLFDLAAISARLSKPLTARLMPLPGKKAGDPIQFDFAYFARGAVMALPAQELKRFFAGEEPLEIHPRKSG